MNKYGDIIGYKERSIFSEKWQGWVGNCWKMMYQVKFNAHIFDFNTGKVIHRKRGYGETQPYIKGEEFEPIDGYSS